MEPKKLSKKEILKYKDEIIKRYTEENITIKELGKQYNTWPEYISHILKDNGIKIKIGPTEYKNNPEIIIKMYSEDRKSSNEIAKELNIGETTVLRILHSNNVYIRTASEAKREYFLDETYFDNIDTPNKAYILGLLYADGCNCVKFHLISLKLQIDDTEILEKVRKEIKIEKPLHFESKEKLRTQGNNHKDVAVLAIYSQHMSDMLTKWGCVESKSLILQFPDFISEELLPHFVRGYFDGDGSISKGRGCSIDFASSIYFLEVLKKIIKDKFNIDMRLRPSENNITYNLIVSKKDECKVILDWMYKDADIYMERKHDIYIKKFYSNNN